MKPNEWWATLSSAWKSAYNEAILNRPPGTEAPPADMLQMLATTRVLRFAGPGAPYPNMSAGLSDLSGLAAMRQLEILVVSHQAIHSLKDLGHLKNLKSLFIFDNQIDSLQGIESLTQLQELYCQNNFIRSLEPVSALINLHTFYCSGNQIASLQGISARHADKMDRFVCLPNQGLRDPEILRFEREVGIRCLRG